jgi:structure-specific recognition protein 1
MRFHVPNNELDVFYAEKEKIKAEAKAEAGDDANEEAESSDDDITASKLFNDRIIEKANIGQYAGAVIASIQELPMQIPRGNYSLDFYSNFAKLHGKTHDYKLMHKDVNKIFLLPKPDGVHMVMLMQLD